VNIGVAHLEDQLLSLKRKRCCRRILDMYADQLRTANAIDHVDHAGLTTTHFIAIKRLDGLLESKQRIVIAQYGLLRVQVELAGLPAVMFDVLDL
jgi:hypothetical protein